MEFNFTRVVPILRIFDIVKADEFYLGFLGLSVDWDHRFEPDAPLYRQISRGNLTLHLSEHHGDGCLRAFRAADWADTVGQGRTTVTVVVRNPEVQHKVRVHDFERWLESQGRTPAEMSLKSRLRELLGREATDANSGLKGQSLDRKNARAKS